MTLNFIFNMKKVCHILLMTSYQDGAGYQENILSKKHVQLGYKVYLVSVSKDNIEPTSYINKDGVCVYLIPRKQSWLKRVPILGGMVDNSIGFYQCLRNINPDILFIHGVAFPEVKSIIRYKKRNPDISVFADNHQDFYNTPVVSFIDKICLRLYNRRYARGLAKIADKVWGVSPWRVDYLLDVYKIESSKTDLLVMGGDEQKIDWKHRSIIYKSFREQHSIPQDAFVVASGGKIDKTKNIHLLIEAVKSINSSRLYLVIFGNYSEDLKEYEKEKHPSIINLGWLASNDVYEVFLASNMAVFPGTHSVLWEQACASGIPCIFKDWQGGFNHVDLGGNCILLKEVTKDSLANTLQDIIADRKKYEEMCEVSENKCRKVFSYIEIAKRAIGIN